MFPAFLKAIISHWVNWMSGLVGVLLWIGGFVADTQGWVGWSRYSFWTAGSVAVLFSFYSVWRDEHQKLVSLQKRLRGFPKLRLAENGFHVDVFRTHLFDTNLGRQDQELYSVVRLRIKNDPEQNTPDSVARGVTANICFYSEEGAKLLELDGRWTDSAQPKAQKPEDGIVPYLKADFPIGTARNLDIATKRFGEHLCFGVNNDSFAYFHLQNPAFRLQSGTINCRVRMRGEYVDETFNLVFISENGPLKAISAAQQLK